MLFLFLPKRDIIGDIRGIISQMVRRTNLKRKTHLCVSWRDLPVTAGGWLLSLPFRCNNISDGWCGAWIWEGKDSFVILRLAKFHWRWCFYRVMSWNVRWRHTQIDIKDLLKNIIRSSRAFVACRLFFFSPILMVFSCHVIPCWVRSYLSHCCFGPL